MRQDCKSNLILYLFIFCCSIFLFSCSVKNKENSECLYLKDSVSWLPINNDLTEGSLVYAQNHSESFAIFTAFGEKQLYKLTKRTCEYLWLKVEFVIPDNLKNQDLGFVIPYLKFAEKLWLNGTYIGEYGQFPPEPLSAMYNSHYYFFPQDFLNQNGKNTVFIKVCLMGTAGISNKLFITENSAAKKISNNLSFSQSKIYIFFEGGLFCTFLLFFLLYCWQKQKSYFYFAMMNFSSIALLTPFFATEVPWYTSMGIPFLLFMKVTLCISSYFVIYFTSAFVVEFINIKRKKYIKIIQIIFLFIEITVTSLAKSYNQLATFTPYMLIMMAFTFGYAIFEVIKSFFFSTKEEKKLSSLFFRKSFFLWGTMVADFVLRGIFHNADFPFFTIMGLQITIINFIYYMTSDYNKVYKHNAYLNHELKNEVAIQTQSLSIANEQLEKEMKRSALELEMAATIQNKFFPDKITRFKGWDIGILFKPKSIVSGDFYDYFFDIADSDKILGAGIFDVSGHGISAGLITMLSKDIVEREFKRGIKSNLKASEILEKINSTINVTKGEIENYLTGILINFSDFDNDGKCIVDLANAGHPYPILYNSQKETIEEIKNSDTKKHFGAIGLTNLDIDYAEINFSMAENDILVLYTDGILESENFNHEQFGIERIKNVVKDNSEKSSIEICNCIYKELEHFIGSSEKEDDITIYVLKRENPDSFIETI